MCNWYAGHRLLAFEIGNEPDLFPGVHRPGNYTYADYYREYRRFKLAIRDQLPDTPFAGPDVIVHPEWLEQFARTEAADLKLRTHHFYAEGPPDNPASTIENLLKPHPFLPGLLARLQAAALWGLDLMFTLAQCGAAGVNLEAGVNHLGFLSYYTPIGIDAAHQFIATPLYCGMLAFSRACGGDLLGVTSDTGGLNVTAYAVREPAGSIWLTLINKGATGDAHVRAACPDIKSAKISRLTAPGLASKDGVRLSDATESVRVAAGEFEIAVPAASAALVRLR
jgi:hypothetical protein